MQVRITERDYLEAAQAPCKPRLALAISGIFLLLCLALAFIATVFDFAAGKGGGIGPVVLGVVLYYLVWYWVLLPMKVRRLYSQLRHLHQPQDLEFREEGLAYASCIGSGLMPWDYFIRQRETDNLFTLYTSDASFLIVPKRDLGQGWEVDKLRGFLKGKVRIVRIGR